MTSALAHLVALGVAGVLLAAGPGGPSGARGGPTGGRWRALRAGAGAAVVVATVVVAVAAVARAGPDLVGRPLGVGAEAWRAGGAVVVVVDGRARPSAVLDGLRQAGVDRLDIVVVRTASRAALRGGGAVAAAMARERRARPPVRAGGGRRRSGAGGRRGAACGRHRRGRRPPAPGHRGDRPPRGRPGGGSRRAGGRQPSRPGAARDVSSALVPPSPVPSPRLGGTVQPGGTPSGPDHRILVAGVVPPPRFGRENEVAATARALAGAGADLVDVSLGPRLVGPAVRASAVPVVVTVTSLDAAAEAGRAGAALALVPPAAVAAATQAELREVAVPPRGRGHRPGCGRRGHGPGGHRGRRRRVRLHPDARGGRARGRVRSPSPTGAGCSARRTCAAVAGWPRCSAPCSPPAASRTPTGAVRDRRDPRRPRPPGQGRRRGAAARRRPPSRPGAHRRPRPGPRRRGGRPRPLRPARLVRHHDRPAGRRGPDPTVPHRPAGRRRPRHRDVHQGRPGGAAGRLPGRPAAHRRPSCSSGRAGASPSR